MDKQIEEIILAVKEVIANNATVDFEEDTVSFDGNGFDHIAEQIAEYLSNAGYRKIHENAVVLTEKGIRKGANQEGAFVKLLNQEMKELTEHLDYIDGYKQGFKEGVQALQIQAKDKIDEICKEIKGESNED